MTRRILVADDSSTIQKVIKIAFSRFAVEMVEASSFLEAHSSVERVAPRLVIADASLPGARGPEDFSALSRAAHGAPVLLLFGTYDAVDEAAFRQAGFPHFLKKPFESADLIALADRLLNGELTRSDEGSAGYEPPSPTAPSAPGRAAHTAVIYAPGTFPVEGTNSGRTMPPLPQATPLGAGGRTRGGGPPPPPGSAGRSTTMPPLPSPPSLDLDSLSAPPSADDDDGQPMLGNLGVPPPVVLDESLRGRRVYSAEGDENVAEGQWQGKGQEDTAERSPFGGGGRTPRPFDLSQPPGSFGGEKATPGGGGDATEVEAAVAKLLPALVRAQLEDYCERHFKSLAKDVIANELRRLADEKARHLVDN